MSQTISESDIILFEVMVGQMWNPMVLLMNDAEPGRGIWDHSGTASKSGCKESRAIIVQSHIDQERNLITNIEPLMMLHTAKQVNPIGAPFPTMGIISVVVRL
jgi:uncharacterized protein YegL